MGWGWRAGSERARPGRPRQRAVAWPPRAPKCRGGLRRVALPPPEGSKLPLWGAEVGPRLPPSLVLQADSNATYVHRDRLPARRLWCSPVHGSCPPPGLGASPRSLHSPALERRFLWASEREAEAPLRSCLEADENSHLFTLSHLAREPAVLAWLVGVMERACARRPLLSPCSAPSQGVPP